MQDNNVDVEKNSFQMKDDLFHEYWEIPESPEEIEEEAIDEEVQEKLMKKNQLIADLKVYGAMIAITLVALIITAVKIEIAKAIKDPIDPDATTFKPIVQQVGTEIKYTGNGYVPDDYLLFHSEGKVSDRANISIRIRNTLRWSPKTMKTREDEDN